MFGQFRRPRGFEQAIRFGLRVFRNMLVIAPFRGRRWRAAGIWFPLPWRSVHVGDGLLWSLPAVKVSQGANIRSIGGFPSRMSGEFPLRRKPRPFPAGDQADGDDGSRAARSSAQAIAWRESAVLF